MTTSIDYIVDVEATLGEAQALAERVLCELIQRGIVLSTPVQHDFQGQGPRYATGPNAVQVATYHEGFACGLDVMIGRNIYCGGELGLSELICPNCGHSHGREKLPWGEAIGEWFEERESGLLQCEKCQMRGSASEWQFKPAWTIGNLAFCFSEWFLKESFVCEMENLLGNRIAHVPCQI